MQDIPPINDVVKRDSIFILEGITVLFKSSIIDSDDLFNYSNKCIHNASIYQDQDSVRLAVVVYALYKIHKRFKKVPSDIVRNMIAAKKELTNFNFDQYRKYISKTIDYISKISSIRPYISTIMEDARIKKGAKLVDHGISVAQAATVLGVSQWEVQNYMGKSGLSSEMNVDDGRKRLLNKLSLAKKLFQLN